jgi:hypothetical protein
MRRVVAGFVVLVAASWIAVSCSSGGGGGAGSGGSNGGGSGGTSGGSGGSANGGATGDNAMCAATAGLPKLWRDETPNADCTNCLLNNCCTVIQACSNNDGCRGIFACQVACYSGTGPDGAVLPDDDAGTDDAGNTARDNCAENCLKAATQAAQDLFEPANDCFNGLLPNQCGKPEVCD